MPVAPPAPPANTLSPNVTQCGVPTRGSAPRFALTLHSAQPGSHCWHPPCTNEGTATELSNQRKWGGWDHPQDTRSPEAAVVATAIVLRENERKLHQILAPRARTVTLGCKAFRGPHEGRAHRGYSTGNEMKPQSMELNSYGIIRTLVFQPSEEIV